MNRSQDVLFARLANFKIDISKLHDHFLKHVKTTPALPYRDNRVDYIGVAPAYPNRYKSQLEVSKNLAFGTGF
ncbi:hypothetical protein [Nitratireductor luteus]|uniref:hypothetical protein n=1 Tax=Nitratireductor luteus TaxID=2976980 RepID=UPI00223F96A1|nr:hypothetical protein [Nitratireductor luteus]